MTESLQHTPLHALHLRLGARMVPFAGYDMPVQYPLGVLKEHLHTRAQAGLFDVSHMGQIVLRGPGVAEALEGLVPVDLLGLPVGCQRYALFTDDQGGILDDLMIAHLAEDTWLLVVNAACKAQDLAHLRQHLGDACNVQSLFDSHALLALQGPAAAAVLTRLATEVSEMTFMDVRQVTLLGEACVVSRSGYTGEDGYEISVPSGAALALAERLLAEPEVEAIGLGARDSLRLEAGLCLYGHDMDPATTPVEANLLWAVSKARRAEGERAGGFPGAERVFALQREAQGQVRVGLLPQARVPVREGAPIVDAQGVTVGRVSSGGFGPTLNAPVAMGYVAREALAAELFAVVRDKPIPLQVSAMPFVPARYHRR